jgi:hypothetical protein
MSIVKSLKNLFYFFQKAEQTNSEFHQDFMALVKVIKEYGGTGSLTHFLNMIKKELLSKNITDPGKAMVDELKEAKCIVREKFLAAYLKLISATGRMKHESTQARSWNWDR